MISVVIPTYEQANQGARYLTELLNSIRKQKVSFPFEVVISDNATDGSILSVLDSFQDLYIRYSPNHIRGASENINNAIDLAKYDKVKIMCQDDIFIRPNSLELFSKALDKAGWVISNSKHLDANSNVTGRRLTKYIHNHFSENITGMPSVIGFRKCDLRFNTNLKTVCDMYFYHQLYELYGQPAVINEFTIGQRYHNASLSRNQPSHHQRDVNWLIRNGKIEGKLPKVVVAVVVYDRYENINRWIDCWEQCDTFNAELVIINNGEETINTFHRVINRPNVGYDIGALQDVCRNRLPGFPDYDYLLWCTDDVVPMEKDFISRFIDCFSKRVQVACMHLSKEITPHIRTTGFCISKSTAQRLQFPADPVTTKEQCYQFEYKGRNSFYNQIVRSGGKIVQVAPYDQSPLYDLNYWCRNEEAKKIKDQLYRLDHHIKVFGELKT